MTLCLPKGYPPGYPAVLSWEIGRGILALGEEPIQVSCSRVWEDFSVCVCVCVCVLGGRELWERACASGEPISLTVIPGGLHARWTLLVSTCVMVAVRGWARVEWGLEMGRDI